MKQKRMDNLYINIVDQIAKMSYAKRSQVGAVIVKDGNIISFGWNGIPSGMDNCCEIYRGSKCSLSGEIEEVLETKPEVLHAESNALMKLVKSGTSNASGATLYTSLSPCFECAKLILQSGITRVVYKEEYRNTEAINFLEKFIQVEQFELAKGDICRKEFKSGAEKYLKNRSKVENSMIV